ncbi:MAG: DUF6054 family protein [Bacillaceae bacterium]
MATKKMKASIRPNQVREILRNVNSLGDIIHVESIEYDDREIVIMVFQKYYMRNSSQAALTVIAENTGDATEITAISTGSSQGMIFKFDWGASDDYAQSVLDILSEYER